MAKGQEPMEQRPNEPQRAQGPLDTRGRPASLEAMVCSQSAVKSGSNHLLVAMK